MQTNCGVLSIFSNASNTILIPPGGKQQRDSAAVNKPKQIKDGLLSLFLTFSSRAEVIRLFRQPLSEGVNGAAGVTASPSRSRLSSSENMPGAGCHLGAVSVMWSSRGRCKCTIRSYFFFFISSPQDQNLCA